MDENELSYQTAKRSAEGLGLSSDWKISDGLGGYVKIAHKCGIYVVGNKNGGYAVIRGETAIANSMAMKDAISLVERAIEPEAKKVTHKVVKPIKIEHQPAGKNAPMPIKDFGEPIKIAKVEKAPKKEVVKAIKKATKSARKPKKTKGK